MPISIPSSGIGKWYMAIKAVNDSFRWESMLEKERKNSHGNKEICIKAA